MKRILLCLLSLLFIFSVTSCGDITEDEAKAKTEELVKCVSENRFEDAQKLAHSDAPLDIKAVFEDAEARYGVDFQSGITISKYTDLSYSMKEKDKGGSEYEVDADITVSGKALELSVEIVKNDKGYGIYSIEIED